MRALFLASTKLGADHPLLLAVARGLKERGHAVTLLGDADLGTAASEIGLRVLPSDERYDISVAFRQARTAAEGLSPAQRGERIADRLAEWSANLAPALTEVLKAEPFDAVVVSTFGSRWIAHDDAGGSRSSAPLSTGLDALASAELYEGRGRERTPVASWRRGAIRPGGRATTSPARADRRRLISDA